MKLNFSAAPVITPLDDALERYRDRFGRSVCLFPIDGAPMFKDVDSAISALNYAVESGVPIKEREYP